MLNKRNFLLTVGAGLWSANSFADASYPTRPVSLIVPFAAGGSTDLVVRPLAVAMEKSLGASLIVVNKGGAGGAIGAQFAARSKADGYTLLVGSAGPIVVNPLLRSNLGYNPQTDFEPIAVIGTQPLALAVNAKLGINSLSELVAMIKKDSSKGFYSSSGSGSLMHLTGELFNSILGGGLTHVAYQGGGPAVQAAIAGDVQFLTDAIVSLVPHHQAGHLKILAICDTKRSALLPNVPTVVEAGYPKLVSSTSNYLLAPKGTPAQAIKKAQAAAASAMTATEVVESLKSAGVSFDAQLVGTPVATYMKAEIDKWSSVIKEAKIRIE